jgi:peroxiredoxin/rhodanese-related sulfurtransferase
VIHVPAPRIIVVLACTAILAVGCADERQRENERMDVAPDFVLPTLEQTAFSLSDHRGQVVLLNFWATWCGPCVIEVPHLVQLQSDFADRGLVIAGVSQDSGDEAFGEVLDFAERFNVNYPLLLDPGFAVSQLYGVHSLPTTIVVDQNGNLRGQRVGLLTYDDLLAMVADLLDDSDLRDGVSAVTLGTDHQSGRETRGSSYVGEISADEAGALYDDGAMVIDLRDDVNRQNGAAIPFALEVSFEELDRTALPANIGLPILLVAADASVSRSAARRVAGWGYMNVYVVTGSFDAWLGAGLPSGDEPVFSGSYAL